MTKSDYNFQVLMVIILILLGVSGIMAMGALMMFLTAFM